MKKRMSILLLALFMTALTACGTSGAVNSTSVSGTKPTSNTSASSSAAPAETADQQAAKKTIANFFAAFAKEDYKTMKTYCTKRFEDFFEKNKQTEYCFGYKNATLEEANLMTKDADAFRKQLFPDAKTGYLFDVTMKGETVPQSALWVKEHPVQEGICTLLIQKVNGNWKLADMSSE